MNTDMATRAPSVAAALSESVAALLSQASVVLLGFIDVYFMARQSVEMLATVSYVAGFVILVNAASYGALQAFLIVGGGCLGRNDQQGFYTATHAALLAGTLMGGGAYLVALCIIGLLPQVSPSAPPDAFLLAVLLTPSILLHEMCLVFRLKAMLLKASVLLVVMSLVLVCTKFFALSMLFHPQSFVVLHPFYALALGSFASALLCLVVTFLLDRWRFDQINRHRIGLHIVAAKLKSLLAIGLPIGAVILLEMSVLGGGQMILTQLGARFGAAFGLVVQLVLMAETVAVALGQISTINVAMALAMRHRGALLHAVAIGVIATMLIHGLIATAILVFPVTFVDWFLPEHLVGDRILVSTLTSYLRYGAVCQFLLAMVVCLASILRGMDDLNHPLIAIAINYLGLGVACSAVITYLTPLRDLGVWIGIAASLLSSVAFLAFRVLHNIKRSELT